MSAATTDDRNMRATPSLPAIAWRGTAVNGVTYYKGRLIADVAGVATKVTAAADLKIRGWCDNTSFVADTSSESLGYVDVLAGIIALDVSGSGPPTVADHLEIMYAEDDHTANRTSVGGTLSPIGRLVGLTSIGGVSKALCEVGMLKTDVVDLVADYVTFTTLASVQDNEGAELVGLRDAGAFTTATNVEAGMAEIYQHVKSVQKQVNVPLTDFIVVSTGAPLGAWNDGVADGLDYIEGAAIRFNVASTAAVGVTIPMPQDMDDTADIVIHILASRVGSSDTTAALTVAAFFQTVGAAYDADTDAAAGDTGAIAGATKVVSELTKTILATDVPAAPCAFSFSIVPTAALDADDMRVHAVWIEYKGKLLTS